MSTSQNTPRAGGMRNVIKCCVITGHQEILKIEKSSRIRLNLPSNLSSISKFKRLSNKKWWPWKLMSWVNKCKLPAIEAIKYNNQLCFNIDDLWNAFHSIFNMALHYQVDINILDEINNKLTSSWALFLKEEFKIAIANCNNISAPSPDKLLWSHLKIVLKDEKCLNNIISIANACIELGFWPSHFKRFTTVVISKLNKKTYDSPKSFKPIVLLNTLGKLIKKVIS